MPVNLRIFLLVCSFFSIQLMAQGDKAAVLPLETFYHGERLDQVRLSPDGSKLIALRHVKDDTLLQLIDLVSGDAVYLARTDNIKYKIGWVRWANNSHLLLSFRFGGVRGMGVKTHETRLFSMEAKEGAEIIPMVARTQKDEHQSQFQDDVIKIGFPDQDHFLLSLDREVAGQDNVYQVNVKTGKMKLQHKHKPGINSWMVDRQGVVRVGLGYDEKNVEYKIRLLPPGSEDWVTAWQWPAFSEQAVSVLGFGKDPKDLYIRANHEGRNAVFKVDLSKADFPRTLLLSHPQYDLEGGLIYSEAKDEPVGIYFSADGADSWYWDEEFKAFQAGLDKVLPDTVNYISDLSQNDRTYLVYSTSVTSPGTYLLGDRNDKSLMALAETNPGLDETTLVAKQKIQYKARDGLAIEGYLSVPPGSKAAPLVVFPHGGPFSSDNNSFDPFTAYLVNKGYQVFQPNFRGSTGYGHEFMSQAIGQYGMAMQDDITDGVQYLIAEGLVDPKRICIMGASYGGYAALLGVARTPDLYQCAISFAGVFDLKEQRSSYRKFTSYNLAKKQMGTDNDLLEQNSPINLVKQIKAPVLLIHGTEDRSVSVKQSRWMANELKSAKKQVQYVELENATHHLDYYSHRKATFEQIDAFLNHYLPL